MWVAEHDLVTWGKGGRGCTRSGILEFVGQAGHCETPVKMKIPYLLLMPTKISICVTSQKQLVHLEVILLSQFHVKLQILCTKNLLGKDACG